MPVQYSVFYVWGIMMQRCQFCGSDLPLHAHFCSNCGHLLPDRTQAVIYYTNQLATDSSSPNTPPLFSSPSYPIIVNAETGQLDTDVTIRHRWVEGGMTPDNPQFPERQADENETVQEEILLPWVLPIEGQLPYAGQAPMVSGTPQVSGVPTVPGTPAAPGNAPLSGPGLPHVAGSSDQGDYNSYCCCSRHCNK